MGELYIEFSVAADVRADFTALRTTLDNARTGVSPLAQQVVDACGELASDLEPGAGTFEIGWRQVLEVGATSAALVATNLDELSLELTTTDEDAAYSLTPAPGAGRPGVPQ